MKRTSYDEAEEKERYGGRREGEGGREGGRTGWRRYEEASQRGVGAGQASRAKRNSSVVHSSVCTSVPPLCLSVQWVRAACPRLLRRPVCCVVCVCVSVCACLCVCVKGERGVISVAFVVGVLCTCAAVVVALDLADFFW